MDSTYLDVRQDVAAHSGGHYTAQAIAQAHNVSDSTVRNRWFPWIAKVAPEPLLKEGKGYTELARSLFAEFAQVPKNERDVWVEAARSRYSHEWASAGVIEGELMPDSVGGTLALLEVSNAHNDALVKEELGNLEDFLNQIGEVEADFSDAELQSFRMAGARRGIQRFKVETQAELDTLNELRQRRMGGKP
ncbi:MAG: hypothetical protein AAGA83_15130 [Cyanobacteria bacterium P01_F01_bin.116]